MRPLAGAVLAAVLGTSCASVVKSSRVTPDYDTTDRTQTVRLAVYTRPPAGIEKLGFMWSEIARRYANHHRDFIAKNKTACEDGIDGVLELEPTLARKDGGVEASVKARILRCSDKAEVWSAEAGGTWPSDDPNVSEVIRENAETYGEEVRPFVAPTFHLLRATLDTLPRPVLDDAGVTEKIELGE